MKFNSHLQLIFLALLSLSSVVQAYAGENKGGFSLGGTRVIYDASKNNATIDVYNTAKNNPFLAQSWITNYQESDKTKPPFVITPPLYRQDQGHNTLRIMRNGGNLPTDRESAFWLNVKAVPAGARPSEDSSKISFAYVLRVKLFYRPAGLESSADTAYKSLSFSQQGNKIVVTNPTPYFISFNKLAPDDKNVPDLKAMVPPKGTQTYVLPGSGKFQKVSYRTITDLGALTPPEVKVINH